MLLKRTAQFTIIILVVAIGYYFYSQVQSAGTIGKSTTPTGLEAGLTSHWTFDGPDINWTTVIDVSGGGGTGFSHPVVDTRIVGKVGQAINLGATHYIRTNRPSPDLLTASEATISVWALPVLSGKSGAAESRAGS